MLVIFRKKKGTWSKIFSQSKGKKPFSRKLVIQY